MADTINYQFYKPSRDDQLDVHDTLANNMEKIDSVIKENDDAVNAGLANDATKSEWISVKQTEFGAVSDYDGNTGTDNYNAFNSAINHARNNNKDIYIPSGSYFINGTLDLSNLHVFGDNNTFLIFPGGITAITAENHPYLENIRIKCQTKNHSNLDSIGINFSRMDNGLYIYTQGHKMKDVFIENFTISIQLESVYWIQLENVETVGDFKAFTLNKNTRAINGDNENPTTTLYLKRCYFRGANGTTVAPGSIGIDAYNIVSITMEQCVTEWYEELGFFHTTQTASINDMYLEYATRGFKFHNVSGKVIMKNPYFNSNSDYTIFMEYGILVNIGGRGVQDTNACYLEKGAESTYIELTNPNLAGGKKIKSNGYQNQNITELGTSLKMFDSSEGIQLINQGYRNTYLKNAELGTNLNDYPLKLKIGSHSVANITTNGIEYHVGFGPVLTSPDLSKWKLEVGDDGTLTTTKIT